MTRKLFINDPSLFKFWDSENNPGVDVSKIPRQSGFEYNLRCPDCKHRYRRKIHGLNECKFCTNQERCVDLTCEMCFNNSLASRVFDCLGTFLLYTSLRLKRQTLSTIVRMVMLFNRECAIPIRTDIRRVAKSNTKTPLDFLCQSCWHVFKCSAARVDTLVYCPFCSTIPKQLCPSTANCDKCFDKSFASHPRSMYWDSRPGKNQGKSPHDVFKSGVHRADFICDGCNHEFQSKCNSVSTGFWCPYCAGQKRCVDKECDMCANRKLSSHPAAKYWSCDLNPSNITPDQISLTNGRDKWWFNCENGVHPPYQRDASHIRRNQMCSECSCTHKTELMVCEELHNAEIPYSREFAPQWCRTGVFNSFPRFDVCIDGKKLLIEIDGEQHFVEKWKFGCPIKRRRDDVWKMKQAVDNNFSGIRLYQPDVYANKIRWQQWLSKAMVFIESQSKPCWVFQKSQVYDNHAADCIAEGINVHILE
jgi:hypothetical protein